jgi:hypothetical protein
MASCFGSTTLSFRKSPEGVLNIDIAAQRNAFVLASDEGAVPNDAGAVPGDESVPRQHGSVVRRNGRAP